MSTSRRFILLSLIAGLCLALDQATKAIAREQLAFRPPISLLGNTLRLEYVENPGAFLGLGADLPPQARTLLFGVFVGLMLIGVSVYLLTTEALTLPNIIAGALIVAGGLGNLIDRIRQQGVVTDFLNIGIGPVLRTGIFNIADVAIMAGVGLLLLQTLKHSPLTPSGESRPR